MKNGRPKKQIDWKIFEIACQLLATEDEICSQLNISPDTLVRRVKEKFGVTFAEFLKKSGGTAKLSLRRNQFNLSRTNAAMAIFLGKNYLGQRDEQRIQHSGSITNPLRDKLSKLSLEELKRIAGIEG